MNSSDVDWVAARVLVHSFLSRRLRGPARSDLDDLANIALGKLHEMLAKGPVDRVEGILMTIGHRALVDYWRRKSLERRHVEPLGPEGEERQSHDEDPFDQLEDRRAEVRWVILAYFRRHAPKCHDLALSYFAEESWEIMGRKAGKRADAVKREWHRCVARMTQSASRNPRSMLIELKS